MIDSELLRHDCPIEGEMMIETGEPCNWCGAYEGKQLIAAPRKADKEKK